MKLASRSSEQLQELDDRRTRGIRPGGCSLVAYPPNSVIGVLDQIRHGTSP
jgi:hypothetical protein